MAIRLPYSIGQSLKKGFSGETEKLIKKKKNGYAYLQVVAI